MGGPPDAKPVAASTAGQPAFAPLSEEPKAPLEYAAGLPLAGMAGVRRNLRWCLFCSIVAVVTGGIATLILQLALFPLMGVVRGGFVVLTVEPEWSTVYIFLITGGIAFVLVAGLGVYWLVWIHKIHREIWNYTAGAYPISAARAVGFYFIPLFNLYWHIRMPRRFALELETQLGPKHKLARRVGVCQTLALFPGAALFGMGPLFRAMTMLKIQGGLNELWKRSGNDRWKEKTDDAAASALAAMASRDLTAQE